MKLAIEEMCRWFRVMKTKYPNLHICCSYRDQQDQEAAFIAGTSHLHYPESKHNKMPSWALDVFQIDENGQAVFDKVFYTQLAADTLSDGHMIVWGGRWQTLSDKPHFEYNPDAES